MKKINEMMDI